MTPTRSTGFEQHPPRIYVAALGWLVGILARRADAVVTVSHPIADRFVQAYRLTRPPIVVLNCPPLTPPPAPTTRSGSLDGT